MIYGFHAAVFNEEHKDDLRIDIDFTTERLSDLASGFGTVCLFVDDSASAEVLKTLSLLGIRIVAMRVLDLIVSIPRLPKPLDISCPGLQPLHRCGNGCGHLHARQSENSSC